MVLRAVASAAPAGGGAAPASANTVAASSPTSGQTVSFANNGVDQTLYLTPAGTLAALTVTLPSNASSRIGQAVVIATTQTITALTVNGATNIINNPTTLTGGSAVMLQKMANDTWMQV